MNLRNVLSITLCVVCLATGCSPKELMHKIVDDSDDFRVEQTESTEDTQRETTTSEAVCKALNGVYLDTEYIEFIKMTKSPKRAYDELKGPLNLNIDSEQAGDFDTAEFYGMHEGGPPRCTISSVENNKDNYYEVKLTPESLEYNECDERKLICKYIPNNQIDTVTYVIDDTKNEFKMNGEYDLTKISSYDGEDYDNPIYDYVTRLIFNGQYIDSNGKAYTFGQDESGACIGNWGGSPCRVSAELDFASGDPKGDTVFLYFGEEREEYFFRFNADNTLEFIKCDSTQYDFTEEDLAELWRKATPTLFLKKKS